MGHFRDRLIFDNTLLRVLEHFRVAKVDYAKNVTRYTEIQRDAVQRCLGELESEGLIEKYTNTSIKKADAKLKKSPEVHKHHTYYQLTRAGVVMLNSIGPSSYSEQIGDDCVSMLSKKKLRLEGDEKCQRMINMGLLDRKLELTRLGKEVLKSVSAKKIR